MKSVSILIAESGASKTAWRLCVGGSQVLAFESVGLNPSALDNQELYQKLKSCFEKIGEQEIAEIYFYGAGLKYDKNLSRLRSAISHFSPTSSLEIQNDLTAAIRSTGKTEGIVAILGTGSNVCYFKEGKPKLNKGGHGYLLGDEGSGMDLGKFFVKGLLDNRFSKDIVNYVLEKEGMNLGALRTSVYESAQPNKRLASFAPYLSTWREDKEVAALIRERFYKFLYQYVCSMPQSQQLSLDFVGSISVHFTSELRTVCEELDLYMGKCIASPIESLIKYHLNP